MRRRPSKKSRRKRRDPSREAADDAAKGRERSFVFRFLWAALFLVVLAALIPEGFYGPFNRITALLSGEAIGLFGIEPIVQGTVIRLGGFSVNIIAECTALHLMALYTAFIIAFPGKGRQKLIGLGAGSAVIYALNIIRIAAIALIGFRFPSMFEISHIYLGQLGMIAVVTTMCLMWSRYILRPEMTSSPLIYLARFTVFSAIPFLIWLPLNRSYIKGIDSIIKWLFSLTSCRLEFPYAHQYYNQTFSLAALTGLLLAVQGGQPGMKTRWIAYGLGALTLFQALNRLCNVWISAFDIQWVLPLMQAVYVTGVYILPIGVAILFMIKTHACLFNKNPAEQNLHPKRYFSHLKIFNWTLTKG